MYTITVKISDRGTVLTKEDGTSVTGHMWYSLSKNGVSTGSYGFAPKEHGLWKGEGKVYIDDDDNYASNYYTGEIVIMFAQYASFPFFKWECLPNPNKPKYKFPYAIWELERGAYFFRVIADPDVWEEGIDPNIVIRAQVEKPDNSQIWMTFQNTTQYKEKETQTFQVVFEQGKVINIKKITEKKS